MDSVFLKKLSENTPNLSNYVQYLKVILQIIIGVITNIITPVNLFRFLQWDEYINVCVLCDNVKSSKNLSRHQKKKAHPPD